MGKQYEKLNDANREFIANQKMFFIASHSGGETNLSPRGYDCLRVLDDSTILFLDYAGSGNRTGRDIRNGGEVTVMFNAFEGDPRILRLFCKGEIIDSGDAKSRALFDENMLPGVRQFIKLHIYCVESSCGMSVPLYEYKGDRKELQEWAVKKEETGTLNEYIESHDTPPDLSKFRP